MSSTGPRPIVASNAGAAFSACRRWRYLLWRRWDAAKPAANFLTAANFLVLNPSTADEFQLDPTCARAHDYAKRWGYGALIVTNVFAWRATDPAEMKAVADPVGPVNDRAAARARALRVNGSGQPSHPLYLPGMLRPTPWPRGRESP